MYIGGSVWQPPSSNPFGSQVVSTGMTASAALASASTANVHGNTIKAGSEIATNDSLTAKKNMLLKHLLKEEEDKEESSKNAIKEKKSLSDRYVLKYIQDFFQKISTHSKRCLTSKE